MFTRERRKWGDVEPCIDLCETNNNDHVCFLLDYQFNGKPKRFNHHLHD